jgi:1-acyl-sn-glycerol-3-phosphate acyltransferase
MGKSEILSYPLMKTFFKRLNIPVYRNDRMKAAKSFIQAKTAIKEGWSIVIFPEGGIPDFNLPEMVPFKDGAFKLSKHANIPIVPITFVDHYHMMSDPDNVLGYAHPGVSRIYMHEVISVEQQKNMTETELSEVVFNTIASPLRERGLMKN